MRFLVLFLLLITSPTVRAQWDLQNSHTEASLRGVHSLGNGVAWASGTDGTVLRTEDAGVTWKVCGVASGAEKLDFRGIQAFDSKTAIVMSSGKGDLSRVYKTTDGCQTWKLVFTNPDEDGFFDAIQKVQGNALEILGDPVNNTFALFSSSDLGETWVVDGDPGRVAAAGAGAFAASNSSLIYLDPFTFFATGASSASPAQVFRTHAHCVPPKDKPLGFPTDCTLEWSAKYVQVGSIEPGSGVFSLAASAGTRGKNGLTKITIVAVGGTYTKPDGTLGTAASSIDGGLSWLPAITLPHGYRSSIAYDAPAKTWITVGPNGTDISTDDGRNWRALKPGPGDALDADKNWNALSLPFVVGPHGRIGLLRKDVLVAPAHRK